MAADQAFFLAPSTVQVQFVLDQVDCVNNSLRVMLQAEELPGVAEWLHHTFSQLSPEQRITHQIVTDGLFHALLFERPPMDYPTYLKHLARRDPLEARDAVVHAMIEMCADSGIATTADALLKDEDTFITSIHKMMNAKDEDKISELDVQLYKGMLPLLQDPPVMMATIVDHLQYMWQTYCEAEWQRNLPTLREALYAFEQMDYRGLTALEAIRSVTGRDVSNHWANIDKVKHLIFVPSMHIGPYISYYLVNEATSTYQVVFGAHIPRGFTAESTALTRSDLIVRLSALTDETRLAILELLTHHNELCAQEIITRLELSQSSASRHLRQLTASGYLVERRRDVAKCYALNRERIDDTLEALRRYLGA